MRKEQIVAPLILFYSYAHEDQTLRDQLEKHLRQLQRLPIRERKLRKYRRGQRLRNCNVPSLPHM